jgi:hypothetical protein
MSQLNLFPPPGSQTQPLPPEVHIQIRKLLAELLAAVLAATSAEPSNREGENDE